MRLFLLLLFCSLLFSCGTGNVPSYSSTTSSADYGIAHYATGKDDTDKVVMRQSKLAPHSKMIIYNAFIKVVAKNVDTLHKELKVIAERNEGYVLTLGDHEAVIRVKSGNINQALAEISKTVKLKSKTVRGEDVTEEFMNLQVRLDNANKSRQRYLELLQKATTVEETLKVEKELERLNLEIDLLEGKMNKMSHLVNYSTIRIQIEKKKVLGPLGYLSVGIYKLVKVLFVIRS